MNEQQDEHYRSPERRTPRGVLTVQQTLEALVYARTLEKERGLGASHDTVSDQLCATYNLVRYGFSSSLVHEYAAVRSLDFGEAAGSDFWEAHKETLTTLEADLYAAYVEEVAAEAAAIDSFIETYPQLLVLDDPTGRYVQGVDAVFEQTSDEVYASAASLVIYTDAGEVEIMHTYPNRSLFVNVEALPKTHHAAVTQYRRDFAV